MAKDSTIHFVLMGGTIDSYYSGCKDTVITRKESIIERYIEGIKPYFKSKYTSIAMKDSRDLKLSDFKKMAKIIENSPHKKIIITHGTYAMSDSARYLKAHLKRKDQTIIFTGSMIPIDSFTFSDGGFNLGFAIAKLDSLEPGVYVCFNACIFSPDEVAKQLQAGKFFSIFSEK